MENYISTYFLNDHCNLRALIIECITLSNTIWNPNPMFNGNIVLLRLQNWIHGAENKTELVM
jgi:hypothetical protein